MSLAAGHESYLLFLACRANVAVMNLTHKARLYCYLEPTSAPYLISRKASEIRRLRLNQWRENARDKARRRRCRCKSVKTSHYARDYAVFSVARAAALRVSPVQVLNRSPLCNQLD